VGYYKYTSTRDRLLWLDDISIDGNFHAVLKLLLSPIAKHQEVFGRTHFYEEPLIINVP